MKWNKIYNLIQSSSSSSSKKCTQTCTNKQNDDDDEANENKARYCIEYSIV